MTRLKVEKVGEGLHPGELVVSVRTKDGPDEMVIDCRLLRHDSVQVYRLVQLGAETGFSRVELPRETSRGTRLVWVRTDDLVDDDDRKAYVVLDEDVDHDELVRFAQKQGWVKHHTYPVADDNPCFEEVWSTPDKSNGIHYIDDPRFAARFLTVEGRDLRAILFEVARHLRFLGDEELVYNANDANTIDEAVTAILRMGVGFPTYDEKAFKILSAAIKSEHRPMREAAIQAIAYHHWPEAQSLLAEVVRSDPDETVKAFAKPILETSRRLRGEQGG